MSNARLESWQLVAMPYRSITDLRKDWFAGKSFMFTKMGQDKMMSIHDFDEGDKIYAHFNNFRSQGILEV